MLIKNSFLDFTGSFSRFIALSHSVFALPFSISSYLLANRANLAESQTGSNWRQLLLIVLAVFFARSAAMSFNRLVDYKFDKLNPRTANRELVTGKISLFTGWVVLFCSLFLFLFVSFLLGYHCFYLSPLVLLILFFYSFTKRFTSYSHLFLGLALALAPMASWWVLRKVEMTPFILSGAVLFWVSGFDILYSSQDIEFDSSLDLYSIPRKLGLRNALILARVLHLVSFLLFLAVGYFASLGSIYYFGVFILGLLFLKQHLVVNENDLSQINKAFFTYNGALSLLYLLVVMISL